MSKMAPSRADDETANLSKKVDQCLDASSPKLEKGKVLVWTGVPAASGADKLQTLKKVFIKRLKEAWKKAAIEVSGETSLDIPTDEAGATQGFAMLTFAREDEARVTAIKMHQVALDKKHPLRSTRLNVAPQLIKASSDDEYLAVLKQEAPARIVNPAMMRMMDKSHARDWLKDDLQREMFLIRGGDDTLVYWFDGSTGEVTLQCDGEEARNEKKGGLGGGNPVWTNLEAFWSPQGTHLCTLHTQGVRLWTGANFAAAARLQHPGVREVLFSPNEQFVVTWNGITDAECSYAIVVHSLQTAEQLLTLPPPPKGPTGTFKWPLCAWSHDSNYLAIQGKNGIAIYAVPSMQLIPIPDTLAGGSTPLAFDWQPNSRLNEPAVLSMWLGGLLQDAPGRLVLLEVPSMKTLTSRNLFAVNFQGRIMWQKNGNHCGLLCQVARRLQRKKRSVQTQFEIIRMREKNLPIDSVVFDDEIVNVFWCDTKDRFAVLTATRKMRFYVVNQRGCELAQEIDVPREINTCVWSPMGSHFVMASVCTSDHAGLLWFGHCLEDEAQKTYTVEVVYKDEVNKLVDVEFDRSGRFVLTSVSFAIGSSTGYRFAGAAGYQIWSFQGRPLYQKSMENLHSIKWRPHPPSLLSDEEVADIKSRIKEYGKKLDSLDQAKKAARREQIQADRERIYQGFMSHVENMKKWFEEQEMSKEWKAVWAEYAAQHPTEEEIIETTEQISEVVKPTYVAPSKA